MRLCLALVSLMIVGAVTFGFNYLACAQPPDQPDQIAQMVRIAQIQPPAVQISWMQSSARPRWGGGQ